MSHMNTDENIELHITPSADDILEVSPVNDNYNQPRSFPPGSAAGNDDHGSEFSDDSSSGNDDDDDVEDGEPQFAPGEEPQVPLSPMSTAVSPTASIRHRRSQMTNDAAFSSSSEGSSDDEEDDGDAGRIQPPPNAPRNSASMGQNHSNNNNIVSDPAATDQEQQHSHQLSPNQSQQQRKGSSRGVAPQSEFDKAVLTGVPSRGYATSFFSADSTDSADAETTASGDDQDAAISQSVLAAATAAIANQQQQSIGTGSWDESSTADASAAAAPHSRGRQGRTNSASHTNNTNQQQQHKERISHRVNITTTTTQPSLAASVNSSSRPNQSNNSSSAAAVASYSSAGAQNNPNSNNKNISKQHNASFDSSGALHAPNSNNSTADKYGSDHVQDVSSGVLPDVLMTMRQKIESMQLFDSDMMKLAATDSRYMDEMATETRESLKRSSQQSISAAVLVSLAHKRYERRRLAAMEIEKVVRSLVQQNELERVRAILLLLSDDYVRSTSEDARKGGVVALAACAIGLKKAHDDVATVMECRDLILASVVHACQDHSQRVRYYATESLFNVVKVIPGLAVQHFFILFEILRSLYADVDVDVRSGAELLDKKLKEVILVAVNSGSFSTDACVPVFARFVYMRNKATKRLTLSWLQELNEKLIGAPILEFLHLFLGGIFDMVADPSMAIRQSALAFLQSVLPKLLVVNSEAIDDMDDSGMKVDFDKILQSLVTTMEHPDPFVRKVAMFWMSRIVKAHMKELHANQALSGGQPSSNSSSPTMMNPDGRLSPTRSPGFSNDEENGDKEEDGSDTDGDVEEKKSSRVKSQHFSAASISVRNSLPHVLPGILLSIGDTFNAKGSSAKDSFLPDQTTNELAEQTNACLRDAVRRDGQSYVQHLDSFIVALREELQEPGGLNAKNPPAQERSLYRLDVNRDGTGIESSGWFRASNDTKDRNETGMVASRLCALHWIIVLYESVVPATMKAEYAREFIIPIIHQLVDNPPERIVFKSLEVLAKITVPVSGEDRSRFDETTPRNGTSSITGFNTPQPAWASPADYTRDAKNEEDAEFPMTDANASFALDILHPSRRKFKSRDREVFTALIQLHAYNQQLLVDLSRVIAFMCKQQPPEFVFVSFAVELDRFVRRIQKQREKQRKGDLESNADEFGNQENEPAFSSDLQFVASFAEQMSHVLLNAGEAQPLRDLLRDCVGSMHSRSAVPKEHRQVRLFHIMLHSFSHSLVATVSLCLWGGAYRTASMFLSRIVPLDINLMFLLELDKLVEQLERPLFRHLHVRMLERDGDPTAECSGAMLFKTLKFLLMIIPQSTCYSVLRDRLTSISRFRQSTGIMPMVGSAVSSDQNEADRKRINEQTEVFVDRVLKVRAIHCGAMWQTIRSESLETQPPESPKLYHEEGESRRQWLGYASIEEQQKAEERYRREKRSQQQGGGLSIEELQGYQDLGEEPTDSAIEQQLNEKFERETTRVLEETDLDNNPTSLESNKQDSQPGDDHADGGGNWKSYWEDD